MSDYVPQHSTNVDPDEELPAPASLLFGNKAYDLLKMLALIVFPALGTAYFSLAGIWGLPAAEQVVGTIVVLNTFLGVLLGVATRQYANSDARFDGQILVEPGHEPDTSQVRVQAETSAVATKDEVTLRVKRA